MKANRFRVMIVGAFAVGLVLIVAACGGGASATPEPTPAPDSTATPLPPTTTSTPVPLTATPVPSTPTPTPRIGAATPTPAATAMPTSTPPANRPPTADFTFQPDGVARGDNNETIITFTATASDPDGDPLTFHWRFSSGTPPRATGQVATTTFPGIRPYTVTLTVSDGRGETVTVRKTVPVTG